MKSPYYELHVTFTDPNFTSEPDDSRTWSPRQPSTIHGGWKFSRIDGDPVLGAGVKMYLTRHCKSSVPEHEMVQRMSIVAGLLQKEGFRVLRKKIELVIYDEKVS